jgi:excisionase family DNA binding protein
MEPSISRTKHLFEHFKSLADGDVSAAAMLTLAASTTAEMPDGDTDSKFLTAGQVAKKLGVSRGTIYAMVSCGKLLASRVGKGRGTILFNPADVRQFQRETAGSQMPIRRFA